MLKSHTKTWWTCMWVGWFSFDQNLCSGFFANFFVKGKHSTCKLVFLKNRYFSCFCFINPVDPWRLSEAWGQPGYSGLEICLLSSRCRRSTLEGSGIVFCVTSLWIVGAAVWNHYPLLGTLIFLEVFHHRRNMFAQVWVFLLLSVSL